MAGALAAVLGAGCSIPASARAYHGLSRVEGNHNNHFVRTGKAIGRNHQDQRRSVRDKLVASASRSGRSANRDLTRRLEDLEEAAAIPRRVHFIFDEGHGQDEIDVEIASRIAEGHAKEGDVFQTFGWMKPDPMFPNGRLGWAVEG